MATTRKTTPKNDPPPDIFADTPCPLCGQEGGIIINTTTLRGNAFHCHLCSEGFDLAPVRNFMEAWRAIYEWLGVEIDS